MYLAQKKYLWALIYGLVLTAFTVYVILDTFVITRIYSVIPTEIDQSALIPPEDSAVLPPEPGSDEAGTTQFSQSPIITEKSYHDQNSNISITEYRKYDTCIYVAEVYLSSAEHLKTAFAASAYGRNITEKTSEIAKNNAAILAINGDYYGVQTKGYVCRNGVLYRESGSNNQEDLVIWSDGSFEIITEGKVSAAQLLDDGAAQILSFGPTLLMNGKISVFENDEVDKAKTSNPRTAIGILDDLHYVFVVSDGRTDESEGLTLYQLAAFMQSLGADIAYNLDGGGSSTMYFNGEILNKPTTNGNTIRERNVSDIVYIR